MNENIHDAKQEMKRVDHLIYVSLKYTRTVDVIRSVIGRMISSFDCAMLALLEHSKDKKLISAIPQTPLEKCQVIIQSFKGDNQLKEYLEFYMLLRKLTRAPYSKREEYRRHVTMISKLDTGDILEVHIDLLHEYFDKTKGFVDFVSEYIK